MKRAINPLNAFIIGGFVTSLFNGFLNPLYVTLILTNLDGRVIATGSLLSSAFPVLVGLAFERRAVLDRLYAILPAVMLLELLATAVSAAMISVNVSAYYLLTMLVFGIFTTSVVYLLQKLKEARVRKNRAAFDRRCAVADALGYLAGSAIGIVGVTELKSPSAVAMLGMLQTAIVYGLYLMVYRRVPARRRGKSAEEEPHPREDQAWITVPLAVAA